MKKYMVLLLFCCVILFCFTGCFLFSDDYSMTLDTPKKISEVYHTNEELFNTVAEMIKQYSYAEPYVTSEEKIGDKKSEIYYTIILNGFAIVVSEELSDSDYQAIYEAFQPLYSTMLEKGFQVDCCMYYSRIEFVLEDNGLGKYAELFYFEDPKEATEYHAAWETSGDTLQLNDNWIAQIVYH